MVVGSDATDIPDRARMRGRGPRVARRRPKRGGLYRAPCGRISSILESGARGLRRLGAELIKRQLEV